MAMKIGIPKEWDPLERRVALVPDSIEKLAAAGAVVEVEQGLGERCGHTDDQYRNAGAGIVEDRESLLASSDIVTRVGKPPLQEVARLKPDCIHISFLDPFRETELLQALALRPTTAISLEMMPRTTRAQKMDALSSQANLAGYVAVTLAAEHLDKIFPMMTTPAGTIAPARVFIIGAGVAGLQAIATARRLGAIVEAYDTRPVVEEQVRSLGARFVKIDVGETGQTKDGYAKALTEEQLERQREGMTRHCASADVVITTAQVFGRPAPRILSRRMLEAMSPGSVAVDLAVESGGNIEGSKPGEIVEISGVRVIGLTHLPSRVCLPASQVLSNNFTALIQEFWDSEQKLFQLDLEDEILAGCVVTQAGKIVNPRVAEAEAAKATQASKGGSKPGA